MTSSVCHLAVCQNLVPLVNIKIAGKWMFIPLKMVLIGIDLYPFLCRGNPLPWLTASPLDPITNGHLSAWHCCKWPNPKRCQRARTGDSPAKHVDPCGLWLFNLIQDPQIYAKSSCFRKINKGHLVLQPTLFLDFETSDFLKQIWVGNKDCPIDASGQTRLIQKLAFLQDFNKLVPSSDPVAGLQPSNSTYFIRFFRIQHLAGLSTWRFHQNLANPQFIQQFARRSSYYSIENRWVLGYPLVI